jgi:DNA-binding SARP family transcriptional activator
MRYEILGRLRVVDENGATVISAPRPENLLAVLIIHSDHVVPTDQLITEIWGANPPRKAAAALHVYVSQLRKILRRPGRSVSPIVTWSPGYILRTSSDELDFHAFLRLVNEGRGALRDDEPERAAGNLARALELWRGPVFGDLRGGPSVQRLAAWLTEARLECTEMLADARLRLGRHDDVIGHLYPLTAEHPLRESFYRQLMLALWRTHRAADALRVYQTARHNLRLRSGREPGGALQSLHRGILQQQAALSGARFTADPEPHLLPLAQ